MLQLKSLSVILFIQLLIHPLFGQKKSTLDILIQGATVFDGNSETGGILDVGILGDKIVFVGKWKKSLRKVSQVVDASGLVLAPGFIDPHTHIEGDLSDSEKRNNLPFLMQGVTTVIGGNDGGGPLPIGRKLDEWERNGIGTNAGLFIGQPFPGGQKTEGTRHYWKGSKIRY